VRCSVEHAFAVFTARIDAWWPSGHRHLPDARLTLEGRVGGRFFERGADGREHELGEVTRWEPPHRVAYTWHPGALTRPTAVEVRFSAQGATTRVEVTHAEGDANLGEAWPTRAQKFDAAWRHVLPAFAAAAHHNVKESTP
jgi:uncharacterized protein YndB with AHSA1/START domain